MQELLDMMPLNGERSSVEVPKEKIDFTIDLLTSMAVVEIADTTGRDANTVLPEFVSSKTGRALYDETTRIWCNGPSYIADMYLEEIAKK